MLVRLRGRLHLYRFLFGRRWAYFAGSAGLLIGVITMLASPPATVLGIGVAVTATGLAAATFMRDSREVRARSRALHQVEVGTAALRRLRPSDRYAHYDSVDLRDERCLVSTEVNDYLFNNETQLEVLSESFKLSGPEAEHAPFVLSESFRSGAVLFDSEKVRLVTDLVPESFLAGQPVRVQRTSYFASLCTNEIARYEIRSTAGRQPLLVGAALVSENGVLDDLESSRCSNHIGISTLAFTEDGRMVVTTQARGSAQSPGRLTASGSGSADWADLDPAQQSLQTFLSRSMSRELAEECGLVGEPFAIRTRVIGYARVLNRGGKPEFFGLSYIDRPFSSLRVTRRELPFIADIAPARIDRSSVDALHDALGRYCSQHEHTFSLSLQLNIRFLEERIANDPDGFLGFIGGDS